MSVFWKPMTAGNARRRTGSPRKQLGNGTYELWARCDICTRSAPIAGFLLGERPRDGSVCHLCEDCRVDQETLVVCRGAGYQFPPPPTA